MSSILDRIKNALIDLNHEDTLKLVKEALDMGIDIESIVNVLADGMKVVGERFENGEYFIADVIVASEIFKEAMSILRPKIMELRKEVKPIGRVVIGTVYGDIHDIGKNLVATFLEANGFEVIDLGVDVPPEKFVEAIKQYNPDIVGMSALLTSTMMNMKSVIDKIREEGLRDKVKIIVGGAPVTERFAKEIGADAYGENAFKAVEICKRLVEEVRKQKKVEIV